MDDTFRKNYNEDANYAAASTQQMQASYTTDSRRADPEENIVHDIPDTPNSAEVVLDFNRFQEIKLHLNEKISLVYLLYDNLQVAFEYMRELQGNNNLQILERWINSQKNKNMEWEPKVLKTLFIMRGWDVFYDIFSFNANRLQEQITRHPSLINPIKREIYEISSRFDDLAKRKFLLITETDCKLKGYDFEDFGHTFLEMYFLHWVLIGYISVENSYGNVCITLLKMGMLNEAKSLYNTVTNNIVVTCSLDNIFQNWLLDYYLVDPLEKSSVADISLQPSDYCDDIYKINPHCPGVCIIINQESFYSEFEKKYGILPKRPLRQRENTDIDKNKLQETFNNIGFQVIVRNNLTHFELGTELEKEISKVPKNSSLIVCILSHGEKDIIYGVNSMPVEVRKIQQIMDKHNNLQDQPKILILQSCQTVNPYTSEEIPAYPAQDMLTFCAAVPGFIALRDRKNGSYFIESFCKRISENRKRMHFDDICTLVIQDVMHKKYTIDIGGIALVVVSMIAYKKSTLSRFFYLGSKK